MEVACPFFSPTVRAHNVTFPHPRRLPLGAVWRGLCEAPGHEYSPPSDQELAWCNLGYAACCPHLPRERTSDAVRFGVLRDSKERISIQFVFESQHQPAGHGWLEYDPLMKSWISPHPEPRTQRLAESFLESYLEQRRPKFPAST
jgi:hypothetical protein